MEWITYCGKITGVSYRHAWSVDGDMYLKKAKACADACYKSPRHEYVMAFMGCNFHGCQTCFDLSTMNTHLNKYMDDLYRETMVKCKVLPPRRLHIPLLPFHINKKLMFVSCRKCAETENQSICNHSVGDLTLSGTWVSVELQKAVQIGYTLLKVYDVWQYDTLTKYDQSTGDGGLFAQYMNTFMKI